jgi:hypothetical protein
MASAKEKFQRVLRIDYSEQDKLWLTEQRSLRILIGILGVLLPPLLWLFMLVASKYSEVLPSISHYFYTRSNPILIIVVSLLAIFLLLYKGKATADFILSSLAGLGAIFLLIFPTSNLCEKSCRCDCPNYVTSVLTVSPFRENFHYISAATFLICLAGMSYFLFTKTHKDIAPTKEKLKRNGIYRFCGVTMILAMLVVYPGSMFIPGDFYDANHLTFWMETIAVELFGISWLVKAELVLKG